MGGLCGFLHGMISTRMIIFSRQRFDENMLALTAMDSDSKELLKRALDGLSVGGVDAPAPHAGQEVQGSTVVEKEGRSRYGLIHEGKV